ncbi:MAG: DUF4091 domain-containing protein [Bacteroidales bacterium]|jgi:hypothetical protein|nr:Ig-like domain-containing protein [Bacteroidota bacterium]NLN99966.1 DUF4091 domain-containing protein [Bacteroidales bacterium]
MRRILLAFAAAGALLCACVKEKPSGGDTDTPKEEDYIRLDRHELSIVEGETETLRVENHVKGGESLIFNWKSSDTKVAGVSGNGVVDARTVGVAEIYVSARNGDFADTCKVTVTPKPVPATSLSLSSSGFALKVGKESNLTFKVEPANTTDLVSWTSSDESVATVDSKGLIKAVSPGEAVIDVVVGDLKESCTVTVLEPGIKILIVDPLVKVYSGSRLQLGEETIRVAGGEAATAQLLIDADGSALTNIDIAVSSSIGITPKVYWEKEILCTEHWYSFAYGKPSDELVADDNLYPDPLIPVSEGTWNVDAGRNPIAWIEYTIPRGFRPGEYTVSATVTASKNGENVSLSKDFTIKVYNVTLPEEQSLMICNWDLGTYNAMNGGNPCDRAREYELRKILVEFMNDYGQNVWHLSYMIPLNMSWPYLKMNPDGTKDYVFNYSVLDEEIQFFLDNCPDFRAFHAPDFMAANPADGGNLKCAVYSFDEENFGDWIQHPDGSWEYKPNGQGWPTGGGRYLSDPATVKYLQSYFKGLVAYFKTKKLPDGRTWFDLYRQQLAEELNDGWVESWNQYARTIKQAAPDIKLLDPVSSNKYDRDMLDEPVTCLGMFERIQPKETGQWMYTGVIPEGEYANRMIRMPLIKTRILHWINYKYGHIGYLHWGLKYWQDGQTGESIDPFTQDAIQGDAWIVYAGYEKVYPSVRLCAMRDGIKDFDLLKLVEEKSASKAEAFVQEVVQDYAKYNTDVEHFRNLRRRMLEYLEK